MSDRRKTHQATKLNDFERDGWGEESLTAKLRAQDALIKKLEAELEHSRKIFDRSSVAARIGVWECTLPDEELSWTDVIYDLFDLPRGTPLVRSELVKFYCPEAAEELERLRRKAIAERDGFTMEAEIKTSLGNRRWLRITASVECENGTPVRIFGMKQDITEQKMLMNRIRHRAETDQLTGLANRSKFYSKLSEFSASVAHQCQAGILMLIDLDNFKNVNDTQGHITGDACLSTIARRVKDACPKAETVARIGGDEFAVILGSAFDEKAASSLSQQIIDAISRPINYNGLSMTLGASIGFTPIDSTNLTDIIHNADMALYAAKAAGKTTYRIFEPIDNM